MDCSFEPYGINRVIAVKEVSGKVKTHVEHAAGAAVLKQEETLST